MDDETKQIKDLFDKLEQRFKGKFTYYKLDENHNVVECSMFESMMFGMDEDNKIVAQINLPNGSRISTAFLGGFLPLPKGEQRRWRLFETMVFDGPNDGYVRKYMTWDEAIRGHEAAVLLST